MVKTLATLSYGEDDHQSILFDIHKNSITNWDSQYGMADDDHNYHNPYLMCSSNAKIKLAIYPIIYIYIH